jgi:Sigma-54 interaction domain
VTREAPCSEGSARGELSARGTCRISGRSRADGLSRVAPLQLDHLAHRLEAENVYLRTEIRRETGFDKIVGESQAILHVLKNVAQVAAVDSSVLLLGETGTGKELLAHAIHDKSPRRSAPLVTVNCAALPPSLIESELFGHEKGAFSGATGSKTGRFEVAEGGTLFLDEIGELSVDLQVKLLRVLQHGEFERVGSTRPRKVDVRIVAATNRDLAQAMANGAFREDLYFRLSVFPIHVPPLRDRRQDIPLLVWAYINRRQAQLGRRIDRIPKRAMEALMAHAWPGNVPRARERDRACAYPLDRVHATPGTSAGRLGQRGGGPSCHRAPGRGRTGAHPAGAEGLRLEDRREGPRRRKARSPSQHTALADGETGDLAAGAPRVGRLGPCCPARIYADLSSSGFSHRRSCPSIRSVSAPISTMDR